MSSTKNFSVCAALALALSGLSAGQAGAALQEDDQYAFGANGDNAIVSTFDGNISTVSDLVYIANGYLSSVTASGVGGAVSNFNDGTTASVVGVNQGTVVYNLKVKYNYTGAGTTEGQICREFMAVGSPLSTGAAILVR